MKKKEWANAVWLLFHTLATKLKDEHVSQEINTLFTHVTNICNNLPCPDCQMHASDSMRRANRQAICSSKNNLVIFLWQFHNNVNLRVKNPFYAQAELEIYKTANTRNVVQNFINIMSKASNNSRTMISSFHRQLYMKEFVDYIKNNIHKYDA